MIAELEQEIVDWLAAWLPDRRVQAFPDDPGRFDFARGARCGLVLVRWNGGQYGRPRDTAAGHQDREIEWAISVIATGLRDHTGIYPILEATRDGLAGWAPRGGGGVRPVSEGFVAQQGNVWRYELVVTMTLPYVPPAQDEPPLADGITKLTIEDADRDVLAQHTWESETNE